MTGYHHGDTEGCVDQANGGGEPQGEDEGEDEGDSDREGDGGGSTEDEGNGDDYFAMPTSSAVMGGSTLMKAPRVALMVIVTVSVMVMVTTVMVTVMVTDHRSRNRKTSC